VKGSQRWLRKRRIRMVRYLRVYGYVREWQLERWRKLRRHQAAVEREARDEAVATEVK